MKHQKKIKQNQAKNFERFFWGEIRGEDIDMGPYVIPIPNPERSRQKVPIQLHHKIKQTRYPVIGLDYIKEFIAVSDPFSGFIHSPPMNELSRNYSSALPKMLEKVSTSNDCITAIHMSKKVPLCKARRILGAHWLMWGPLPL